MTRWISCAVFALLTARAPAAPQDPFVEINDAVRKSTEKALAWLMKAQNRDGSWGLDKGSQGDITCTSLAMLTLMAQGNTERNGPDTEAVDAVRKGMQWILGVAKKMGSKGEISGGNVTLIQNKLGHTIHTFFATVCLSQILGMQGSWVNADDKVELRDFLTTMAERIAKTQEADGSWHKQTFGSLKATCMAWLALRSAQSAGINVEIASVDKTIEFIKKQYNKSSKLFEISGGWGGYQTLYATASSIRVLQGSGCGKDEMVQNAIDAFMKFVQTGGSMGGQFLSVEGEDYLAASMMSHALCQDGGEKWQKWFTFIRAALAKKQNGDGSWTGTACISGRTFATCNALLALLTPMRMLPIQDI